MAHCFSPVVLTAHEIKKMPGLPMARGTKILVILITLALNEQGFSLIHREKTERQDRPKHLEDMYQMILWSLCCYRLFGGEDIKAGNLNIQELVQDRNQFTLEGHCHKNPARWKADSNLNGAENRLNVIRKSSSSRV